MHENSHYMNYGNAAQAICGYMLANYFWKIIPLNGEFSAGGGPVKFLNRGCSFPPPGKVFRFRPPLCKFCKIRLHFPVSIIFNLYDLNHIVDTQRFSTMLRTLCSCLAAKIAPVDGDPHNSKNQKTCISTGIFVVCRFELSKWLISHWIKFVRPTFIEPLRQQFSDYKLNAKRAMTDL